MEPQLETAAELLGVLEELKRREPIFHHPEFGTTRADFERQVTEDFWEIGASGARYSREFVLDTLEKRYSQPYSEDLTAFDFHCRRLGDDTYLLTYTLIQNKLRKTRRSTIWRQTPDGWKVAFHQGTIVQPLDV